MSDKKIEVEMKLERSTPGTRLYKAMEQTSHIPSLYIRTAALPGTPPDTIKIIVTW